MAKISDARQAVAWCNERLRECASSGSDYYQSLFEVRDVIANQAKDLAHAQRKAAAKENEAKQARATARKARADLADEREYVNKLHKELSRLRGQMAIPQEAAGKPAQGRKKA